MRVTRPFQAAGLELPPLALIRDSPRLMFCKLATGLSVSATGLFDVSPSCWTNRLPAPSPPFAAGSTRSSMYQTRPLALKARFGLLVWVPCAAWRMNQVLLVKPNSKPYSPVASAVEMSWLPLASQPGPSDAMALFLIRPVREKRSEVAPAGMA